MYLLRFYALFSEILDLQLWIVANILTNDSNQLEKLSIFTMIWLLYSLMDISFDIMQTTSFAPNLFQQFADNDFVDHGFQQNLKYLPAIYTHCYDLSGVRLFTAGGPLDSNTSGHYAGLWQWGIFIILTFIYLFDFFFLKIRNTLPHIIDHLLLMLSSRFWIFMCTTIERRAWSQNPIFYAPPWKMWNVL